MGVGLGRGRGALAQVSAQMADPLPEFTGPDANPFWGAVGSLVSYPQKLPLICLTDRPVQLETPRPYFLTPFTPNAAFYVRWHLDGHPQSVDLAHWRLAVEGQVKHPLSLSLADLLSRFKPTTLAAVNQCSGNSRSRIVPRVAGTQWGTGGMGCAQWTGVRLSELLAAAGLEKTAVQVQFEGIERGRGPEGKGAYRFAKSLAVSNPVLRDCVLAYAMNGEPLPLLNGFPLRLVVPGYFATYWVKCLGAIRVLNTPDDNYWMKSAYLIPDTPRGHIAPEVAKAGPFKKVPIGRMPVRSVIVTPDGSGKVPAGLACLVQGVAFSGHGAIRRVELSLDDGKTWAAATLGDDHGPYAFRVWTASWQPTRPGRYTLAVRATDAAGNVQTDDTLWNPGGYGWNRIERQEVVVGVAS